MSKYARIIDIEKLLYRKGFCIGKTPDELYEVLAELPTIEINEDCITDIETRYVPILAPTDDCISREYLIKALDNLDWYDFDMFYKVVENAPSVIPHQKEGEWIRTGRTNIYGGVEVQCSNCADKVMVQHLEDEWYCRHCGADMGMKGAE